MLKIVIKLALANRRDHGFIICRDVGCELGEI